MGIKDRVLERGLPDWYERRRAVNTVAMNDMGELAARLGSINTYDRRGDTLFQDSFEDGLPHWISVVDGAGQAVNLSATYARNGAYSAELVTGTQIGPEVGVQRYQPLQSANKVGSEMSFSSLATDVPIILYLNIYTGSTLYTPRIRWNAVANTLQYLDSSGAWVSLSPTVTKVADYTAFNTVKVVANQSDGKYSYIVFNSRAIDLAGIASQGGASLLSPSLLTGLTAVNQSANSRLIYIDDAIITQNEP